MGGLQRQRILKFDTDRYFFTDITYGLDGHHFVTSGKLI